MEHVLASLSNTAGFPAVTCFLFLHEEGPNILIIIYVRFLFAFNNAVDHARPLAVIDRRGRRSIIFLLLLLLLLLLLGKWNNHVVVLVFDENNGRHRVALGKKDFGNEGQDFRLVSMMTKIYSVKLGDNFSVGNNLWLFDRTGPKE